MKSVLRTAGIAVVALAGSVFLFPEAIIAGPKLGGPGRVKKPPPKPAETTSGNGFEVGPDEMTSYQVDPTSSINEIVFTSKTSKETFKGKTTMASGSLELNPRRLDSVAGSFFVLWKDLDTGKKMRNEHMLAAPWVNADSHPKIEFSVKEFQPPKTPPKKSDKGGHAIKGKLIGTMSMNGKDKDLTIPVTLAYVEAGKDKDGKEITEGIGVKAKFSVQLADFDIKGKGVGQAVAKKQTINVSLFLAKSDGTSGDKGGNEKKDDDNDKKDEDSDAS